MKIFISSTFDDLVEYREVVHNTIRQLNNHAEDMIFWTSDERSPDLVSSDRVKQCDLVILLVAHRYGSMVPGQTLSFVELEYRTAREHGIPVLAFFVDPKHPWPPGEIEIDPLSRTLLENLKSQITKECTRKFFTTPESMGVVVTQAIYHFDKRRHPSATGPSDENEMERIIDRRLIPHNADATVCLHDRGIMQLPLILRIKRESSPDGHISGLATLFGEERSEVAFNLLTKTIRAEARKAQCRRGIEEVLLEDGSTSRMYVPAEQIRDLFAPTILALLMPQRGEAAVRPQLGAPPPSAAGEFTRMFNAGNPGLLGSPSERLSKSRFLGVELETSTVWVVRPRANRYDGPRFETVRSFVMESLDFFQHCTYHLIELRESRSIAGQEKSISTFARDLRSAYETRPSAKTQFEPHFRVRRSDVGSVMVDIAMRVAAIHSKNAVHGDLKPSNILIGTSGPVLIDSLLLKTGDISHGLTPTCAAPEQLTFNPVSPATDVFALGMMIRQLIGGVLTGEVIEYQIPTGEKILVIKDPSVYLSSEQIIVASAGKQDWLEFVAICLRFDPNECTLSAQEFATRLRSLLDGCPLQGEIEFTFRNYFNDYILSEENQPVPVTILSGPSGSLVQAGEFTRMFASGGGGRP